MAVIASDDFTGVTDSASFPSRTLNNALGGSGTRTWTLPSSFLQGVTGGTIKFLQQVIGARATYSGDGAARMKFKLGLSGNQAVVFGRGTTAGLNRSCYSALLASSTSLRIRKFDSAGASAGDVATKTITALDVNTWYFLEYECNGTALTARVFASDGTTLIDSVSATGDGVAGVSDQWGFSNYFSNTTTYLEADDFTLSDPTPTAPAEPTGVTVGSIQARQATVSWTNPSSGPAAKVQYAASPFSTWVDAAGSPTAADATSLTVTGLNDATVYKIRVARTLSGVDSAYVESGTFTTLTLTRYRPSATTSAGSWTASGAASLHAAVNETPASDAEFSTVSVASTMKLKIPSVTDPGTTSNHYVQYRAKGDGATQLKVDLVQGDPSETLIKTVTVTPTTGYVTYTMTLTSGEAATISDYTDLHLKFTSI